MSQVPGDERALTAYLDDLDRRVEPADEKVRYALYCRYSRRPGPDVAVAEAERSAFLFDPELGAVLDAWADRDVDPVTRRRLDLWRKLSLAARIRDAAPIRDLRTELNGMISAFVPTVGGQAVSRTATKEILRTNPDRQQRQEAWQAFAPLAERLDDRMRELLRRRNREAQALGFANYVDISLHLDGLSRAEVDDLFARVDEMTRPIYERILTVGARQRGIGGVEPWDVTFICNQSDLVPDWRFPKAAMLDRLDQYRRRIGVPDGLPIHYEFVDIPFGGLTNFIKIPTDLRILMNAADHHSYYVTLFHEYGHAIHNAMIAQRSFILQKESGPHAEAMAQVSGYFASHPLWLEETADLPRSDQADFRAARVATWVTRLRSLLAMASFERQAYDDPDADLDQLLAESEARYLLVPVRRATRWASDAFYAIYPIYLHNYVVADIISSQVHAALRRDLGEPYGNRQTFPWLVEKFYAHGAARGWRQLMQEATGSDLDPAYLAADLRALAPNEG